jgi:MFS family permease
LLTKRSESLSSKIFPKDTTVRTVIIYNLLQGAYLGYIQIFWQPWLISLGLSVAVIGVLEGLAGRSGILSGFMQTIGGKYSDRVGRRKLVLIGSLFLISCWSVAALAIKITDESLIYAAYVLWGLGILSLPVFDATLADRIEQANRSRVYSVVLMANFLPGSISGFLVGKFGNETTPWVLLLLAAVIESIGFVMLLSGIKDKGRTRLQNDNNETDVAKKKREGFKIRETLTKIKEHRKYFSVFIMDTIGWAIGTSILFAILSSARHFTSFEFGLIALSEPIGIVVGTLPGGWLTARIGARQLLTISEALGAAMLLGWAFYPIEPLIVVYAFMWGFAISTWVPVQFHLSTKTFLEESRGEMLGALGTTLYFVRFFGPIIAASLFSIFGYSMPMIVGCAVVLLTIVFIWKFIPNEKTIAV